MRVESIAIADMVTQEKATVKANPEKFSKALTKAINADGENKKTEDLDLSKESKQSEEDISHLLAGLLNLGMVQTKHNDLIEPELLIDSGSNIVEGVDSPILSSILEGKDKSSLIQDIMSTVDLELSPEEISALQENNTINAKDMDKVFSINQNYGEGNELITKDLSLDNNPEVPLVDFNYSSKNLESGLDLSISKESNISISKLNNEEVEFTKEIEQPNNHLLDMDVNILNKGSINDFNVTSMDTKASSTTLSTENLKNINDAVINLSEITLEGETNVLKVKLYPENLGTVDVTVSMENGKISAKITVDNEHIRGLFTNSLSELSNGLAKENINIGKINVDINNSNLNLSRNNPGFNMNQHGSFHNNRGHLLKNYKGEFNSMSKEVKVEGVNNIGSGKLSILA